MRYHRETLHLLAPSKSGMASFQGSRWRECFCWGLLKAYVLVVYLSLAGCLPGCASEAVNTSGLFLAQNNVCETPGGKIAKFLAQSVLYCSPSACDQPALKIELFLAEMKVDWEPNVD